MKWFTMGYENNCFNTFPITSRKVEFAWARLQFEGYMFYCRHFSGIFWNFQNKQFLELMQTAVALTPWYTDNLFQQIFFKGVLKEGTITTCRYPKIDSALWSNQIQIWIRSIFLRGPCKSLVSRQTLCLYYFIGETIWHVFPECLKKSIAQKDSSDENLIISCQFRIKSLHAFWFGYVNEI